MGVDGAIAAVMIGMTLGVFGGGGSILAVPAFVYLLGIPPVLATAYSLFVVGASTLFASIIKAAQGAICYRTAITFAIPSFIMVYMVRAYLIPAIPDHIGTIGSFELTKNVAIMIFFALLMLGVSFSMLRDRSEKEIEGETSKSKYYFPLVALDGAVVGLLTGIVGAGGGFLIVPVLVLLAKLPIRLAIGTSMLIVSAKSLIGFLGDLQAGQEIDWSFLLTFTGLMAVGIGIGIYISRFISADRLKKSFGIFILIMAIFILSKEII